MTSQAVIGGTLDKSRQAVEVTNRIKSLVTEMQHLGRKRRRETPYAANQKNRVPYPSPNFCRPIQNPYLTHTIFYEKLWRISTKAVSQGRFVASRVSNPHTNMALRGCQPKILISPGQRFRLDRPNGFGHFRAWHGLDYNTM